ncbi:MAG: HetZ-related protein 2 [Prochloraceae cyanobacterium]|nr:HetZ-related protein 2 [Prochloraceae cyanobacterium]
MVKTLKQALQDKKSQQSTIYELEKYWSSRIEKEYCQGSQQDKKSIITWLIGEFATNEGLTVRELKIAKQAMDYRYRILQQRYLGLSPSQAYRNLIDRLSSPVILRQKIRCWVSMSRERQRAVVDVIQEVVQEMLNSDRYIQEKISEISKCTQKSSLRNSLLLANIEEYCLRPVRNQPLLLYRLINFMSRQRRGGMTQVPKKEQVRLISEEICSAENDSRVSLVDRKAIFSYEESQNSQEQRSLLAKVAREFELYLDELVDPLAANWLALYLEGHSQEAIAEILNLPIKKVYRLREKVSYHAMRVFPLKRNPDLVAQWLEISLQEHNLGLTPQQWKLYWQNLSPIQRQLINDFKQGKTPQAICEQLDWKMNQVIGEWSKIYFAARELRTASVSYN